MYPTILNLNFGASRGDASIEQKRIKYFSKIGTSILNEKRFLIPSKINWERLEDVYIYLDIYERKKNCDACLKDYSIDVIKRKLLSLLNSKNC